MERTRATLLAGVTKAWYPLLPAISEPVVEALASCKDLVPEWGRIMQFARYSHHRVRVVIIGQDPYHTPGVADGLAFSTQSKVRPHSLHHIFTALVKTGVLEKLPENNSLESWAMQGVLLLNTSLTTRAGVANAHADAWTPWVDKLIKTVDNHPNKLVWLLWGKEAQKKKHLISPLRHTVLEWCHPASMVKGQSFHDCPHFREVQDKYPDLVWTTDPLETKWFTDGACKNNQRAHMAVASWGVVCTHGPWQGKSWGGALPQETVVRYKEKGAKEATLITARPTNQRAEGLAIKETLVLLFQLGHLGDHTIYTDSMFWINMITDWMPKWKSRTKFEWYEQKNSDITEEVWRLWNLLGTKLVQPKFVHVNAWHDYTPSKETLEAWEGNKAAEESAERYLPEIRLLGNK